MSIPSIADDSAKPTNSHDKPCTICLTPRPVLVRCQIDDTGKWHFVCPGKCWISVSGGVEDARGLEGKFPFYKYGGMWKNKHTDGPLSAKKPKRVKERQKRERNRREDHVGAHDSGLEAVENEDLDVKKADEDALSSGRDGERTQ